jgi:hypothetical protein
MFREDALQDILERKMTEKEQFDYINAYVKYIIYSDRLENSKMSAADKK